MVGDGGKDSFEVVKEFITGLGDRRPQLDEVQAIAVANRILTNNMNANDRAMPVITPI